MNFITSHQIRAARALLDWLQENLSHLSGLSVATIRKIEAGHISPREHTFKAIFDTFITSGIEFFGTDGVRLKDGSVITIEGEDCFLRFLDDVYHVLRKSHGEMLHMHADFTRADDHEYQSLLRMRREGIRFRYLMEEGNTFIPFPLEETRWMPTKYFHSNLQLIYGNRVAHCLFSDRNLRNVKKIVIIENLSHAESMGHAFNFMWDNCRKPTLTTAPVVYK